MRCRILEAKGDKHFSFDRFYQFVYTPTKSVGVPSYPSSCQDLTFYTEIFAGLEENTSYFNWCVYNC